MQPVQLGLEIRRPSEPNHQFLLGLITFLLFPNPIVTECTNAENSVTMQLSRAHILRTWQPDGAHCRWWESRQSETNRFPAAVRSGPRWLVMQLRQPLMLEAVSARGWDGQWQPAGPVGSSISAVGASSLPLELQLADPCRTSWEAFGSGYQWRQLGAAADGSWKPTSFIRLTSESPLSWQAINVTGRHPSVKLNMALSDATLFRRRYGLFIKAGKEVEPYLFVDSSCRPECWISGFNKSAKAVHHGSEGQTHKFLLKNYTAHHRTTLQCRISRPNITLEEPLLPKVPAASLNLSISPVLVAGHQASLTVCSDSLPETQHRCFIVRQGSQTNLSQGIHSKRESGINYDDKRTLVRVCSDFIFNVSFADWNSTIKCTGEADWNRKTAAAHLNITQISEPCETSVDLGPRHHWLVGETQQIVVTSNRCSIWNVSHSCWLRLDGEKYSLQLKRIHQGDYNSTHELQLVEAMTSKDWRVQCSVNQSGLEYAVSESDRSNAPKVFGESDKATIAIELKKSANNETEVLVLVEVRMKKSQHLPVGNISCSASADTFILLTKNRNSSAWLGVLNLNLSYQSVNVCCSILQSFAAVTVFEQIQCKKQNDLQLKTKPFIASTYVNEADGNLDTKMVLIICMSLASLAAGCCIICVLAVIVSSHIKSCDPNTVSSRVTSSAISVQNADQSFSGDTEISSRHEEQEVQELSLRFASVVDINFGSQPGFDNDLVSNSDEDGQVEFTEPAGHYDSDGCTFVSYSVDENT